MATFTAVRDRSPLKLDDLKSHLGLSLEPGALDERAEKRLGRLLYAAKRRADLYVQNPFTRTGKADGAKLPIPEDVDEFVLGFAARLYENPTNGVTEMSDAELGTMKLGPEDLTLLHNYRAWFGF